MHNIYNTFILTFKYIFTNKYYSNIVNDNNNLCYNCI